MTEARTSTNDRLCIKLGSKISDRLDSTARLKNAMATAIILLVENGDAQKNPHFEVYQEIYLEANYIESLLKDE